MKQPFDIFWFGETGRNWIEAVDTLETAKAHIEGAASILRQLRRA
jgi:hypothetical protein